ncbi:hypothetical protein CONPUDRAFT_77049 [Coniophora puteana RWD-64-598 SS2]|uniref:Uncharacterized protein n=1 Tax=Coniophora puteana (strain RWD-64-598) TaxID=741705 RepID=A0A5M3MA79_CONPW|nr:uncharacterized protein CONPUDRAFT_77049 [Coniophora puteana RWD-64-598 SS2]EIW76033.1 hypothetical protein CONPUDRAFT_77049 [Coniophora puteana RWD-64-598 SS2]
MACCAFSLAKRATNHHFLKYERAAREMRAQGIVYNQPENSSFSSVGLAEINEISRSASVTHGCFGSEYPGHIGCNYGEPPYTQKDWRAEREELERALETSNRERDAVCTRGIQNVLEQMAYTAPASATSTPSALGAIALEAKGQVFPDLPEILEGTDPVSLLNYADPFMLLKLEDYPGISDLWTAAKWAKHVKLYRECAALRHDPEVNKQGPGRQTTGGEMREIHGTVDSIFNILLKALGVKGLPTVWTAGGDWKYNELVKELYSRWHRANCRPTNPRAKKHACVESAKAQPFCKRSKKKMTPAGLDAKMNGDESEQGSEPETRRGEGGDLPEAQLEGDHELAHEDGKGEREWMDAASVDMEVCREDAQDSGIRESTVRHAPLLYLDPLARVSVPTHDSTIGPRSPSVSRASAVIDPALVESCPAEEATGEALPHPITSSEDCVVGSASAEDSHVVGPDPQGPVSASASPSSETSPTVNRKASKFSVPGFYTAKWVFVREWVAEDQEQREGRSQAFYSAQWALVSKIPAEVEKWEKKAAEEATKAGVPPPHKTRSRKS